MSCTEHINEVCLHSKNEKIWEKVIEIISFSKTRFLSDK